MTTRTSLKLFVRAEPELGTETLRERLLADVTALPRTTDVDDVEVLVWGKEIRVDGPLTDTAYHRTVLDHVRAFEGWARGAGATLDGGFDTRRIRSSVTGDSYEVVRLPWLCLAVYEDDRLTGVYPCVSDGQCHTVADCVAALADGYAHDGSDTAARV